MRNIRIIPRLDIKGTNLIKGVQLEGLRVIGSPNKYALKYYEQGADELLFMDVVASLYNRNQLFNIITEIAKNIFIPIIAIFIPFVLVASQPDLGTSALILMGGLGVVWLTGFRIKYFLYSFIVLICMTPVAISFLKPYQKSRILSFLDPERDPLGAGYQIIQSKIAVGSGGIFGKGFLQGSQSYLDYLPEKHTDFIFTLFSEEFGFFGSLLLLLIYVVIIYRISRIGAESKNNFSKLYCFGFALAFFIYVVVNMSMVLGLLPIVGAPLPIMSYGGSSMLAIMIGLGIVMSCKVNDQEQITP